MNILNAFTFEATGTEPVPHRPEEIREVGTIEATLAGQTRRVEAVRYDNGHIVSWAFLGRYRTGKKVWPATVSVGSEGREFVWFGKDHHTGRCIKNAIFFA